MRSSTTPPLRWDPSWPAGKPITQHPDFDTRHADDPDKLALFREFGPSPMGGPLHPIEHALAFHPRWMHTPSAEVHHEVLLDLVADAADAQREGRLDELDVRVARSIARCLMRFSQVLRLVDVARLAGCTRVEAWRAIYALSIAGLLVEVWLDEERDSTHVLLVHKGSARMSTIYDRGPGWIAESTAVFDAEDAADAADGREVRP